MINVCGTINFLDRVIVIREGEEKIVYQIEPDFLEMEKVDQELAVGVETVVVCERLVDSDPTLEGYKQTTEGFVPELPAEEIEKWVAMLEAAKERAEFLQSRPVTFKITRIEQARERRNSLLSRSDWTVLPDSPLSESEKNAWIKYRQELRDLFSKYTRAKDIEWPDSPAPL